MNKQALRWAVVLAVAVVGAAVLLQGLVSAKPPAPPPPPPPGSICFCSSPPTQFWAMNADGTGKHPVLPSLLTAIPSSLDLGGHTWWLCVQVDPDGGYYPPGTTYPVREVYLVRADSENVLQSVKLTDLGPTDSHPGIDPAPYSPAWSNDLQDTFVSFIGYDRADCKRYVYRAAISFPSNADPCLSEVPQPIIEVPAWDTPFHWSPDGERIVYQATNALNGRTDTLYMHTVATGVTRVIYEGTTVGCLFAPRWSPPGVPQRIAFANNYALTTIDPDNTSDVKVVYYKDYTDFLWNPQWSPDGKYIVATNVTKRPGAGGARKPDEIAIVPSQGGAKTILTADMPDTYLYMTPAAWRWLPPVP